METKKTHQADLRKWSSTLFNLSLAISIGLCLVAFEWKSYSDSPIKEITKESELWDIPDIPNTFQTPPPPPVEIPPIIQAQPDEIKIDPTLISIDINTTETTEIPEVIISDDPPVIDKAEEIMDFIEVQASFKGGMEAWYEYLRKNLKYPSQAKRMGIEGVVLIRFVVNKDGSVQDVEVVRPLGGGCDEVAKEVVENSPEWIPGKMGGRPVRSRMVIPIRFKLQ
ncbi:energy transducer TonB [Algoriphagus limi]|uniref:Energy transducer TonB n=1 Tax=Algoriphagus limi TaxID=2975273 RepID=A0ABT2G4B6_9BACT|nr:energy transducer TonB [Algoriphagus limi]MCS5490106.1 energy transducer TonB [Algoriphagus limi]